MGPVRWNWRVTISGAIALFVAAYVNSLRNGFHFDDDHVIERNPFIRDLAFIPRFFTDANTFSVFPQNATYRPLVSVTLAIDHAIAGGLDPLPFHVTQLLLFAGVGVLLGLFVHEVLRRSSSTGKEEPWHRWAALFSAAFFCVHTANTQPGNYISARSELLCALGVLGAFVMYQRAPRLRRWHLFLVPMVLGALAKPPAVLFAPLLLLYKLLFEAPRSWREGSRCALSTVPTFAVALASFLFVEGMNPEGQTYGGGEPLRYLWTQAFVSLRYLGLFFVPVGLTADTDLALLPTWRDLRLFAGVAVIAWTLGFAGWVASRPTGRAVAFGILWFWVSLLPTAVVPLAEVTNDHRMFLGYLGLTLAVVALVSPWMRRIPVPATATLAAAVLLAHAWGTHVRNRVWRDEASLWADVVEKSPGNGRGWMNYGLTKLEAGELAEAKRLFEHARTLTPNYPVLEVNLGIVNGALGDAQAAEFHFRRALSLGPAYGAARRYYASWLVQQGRAPEAIPLFTRAISLEPTESSARHALMQLFAARGETASLHGAARDWLELTGGQDATARGYLEGMPTFADPAEKLTEAGRHAEAAIAYRAALKQNDLDPVAWNNLGWALLSLGFLDEAEPAFQRAVELDPTLQIARNNLAETRARRTRLSRP